jgi:autotransporter translocation and assembly factor TamB
LSVRRLPRALATLGLLGLGATGLAVTGLGVGLAFLASAPGNRFLRDRIESAAQGAMVEGGFALGALETDLFRRLHIGGLRIEDGAGAPVVEVDRLDLRWRPAGLARGVVRVDTLEAQGVRVDLHSLPDGNLDLLALFGVPPADPEAPVEPFSGVGIDIDAGAVRLDDVAFRLRDAAGADTVALAGSLSTPLQLHGRDVRLPDVALDVELSAPVALPVRASGGVGLVAGALELAGLDLQTDHSRLAVDGVVARVETAPAPGLQLGLHPLAAADVEALSGQAVLARDLEIDGRLHGELAALRLEADASAGESGALTLSATAGVDRSPMSWTLDARTDALALDGLLLDIPEPVRLQGRYRVGAVGVDWPGGLDATVRVEGGEQVLWGERVDDLTLTAQVSRGVVSLESLSARHAVGTLAASGEVDVPGETADLTVRARVPRLAGLARFGAPPLHGGARFDGPVRVDWGADRLAVDAEGQLAVSDLDVSGLQVARITGPAAVRVRGESVAATGSLGITDLRAPGLGVESAQVELDGGWSPAAGAQGLVGLSASGLSVGDGAVKVRQLVGSVRGSAPPDGAPAATAEVVVADLLLGPAEVEAEGGPVEAVLAGDSVLVEFDLARRTRPFFSGRVRGDLGLQEWVAEDLVLAPLDDQAFEADGPVRFTLVDGGFRGLEARLVSDGGTLSAHGDLVPTDAGASDLTVRVESLDLASVARIHDLYRPPVRGFRLLGLAGRVDLAATLRGEGALVADVSATVDGLHTTPGMGVEVDELDLSLALAGALETPDLHARASHDGDLLVDLRGRVPLTWQDGVPAPACGAPVSLDALLAPGDVGRLHARVPDIPELDALGSASVRARGPLCDPEVRLVSTWSLPLGPSGERVGIEFDAERRGPAVEVWGALEEGLARRLLIEGGASSPASESLSRLVEADPDFDPAQPEAWLGDLDLRVVPMGVPLTRLVELAGVDALVQGRLQGGLSVTGPVMQPAVAGALLVDGGRIGSVPVSEAQLMILPAGEAGYSVDGRLGFGRNNALGALDLEGEIPVRIDLSRDPDELLQTRGLSLRVDGAGVPLSVLEGVSPDIEQAAGRLTLGGFVTGSLADPLPNFVVGVRDGLVVHRSLGVRYSDMELDLRANGHRLELARFSLSTTPREARTVAGRVIGAPQPGTLLASGDAGFGPAGLEDIGLAVQAEGLWLSNRPEARFRVDGDLDVQGRWPALSVGGRVEMVEGNLILDERVFMDSGDLALDPSITVLRPRGVGGGAALDEGSVFDTLDLDVKLDLHRGLRLRAAVPMDDSMGREVTALSTVRLDAELASPELRVQSKDGALVVHGQVELPKGQLTLVGSKFELAGDRDNALNFISDDYLEPTIDITAQKATRSYGTVEARVSGSPSAPEVRFDNPDYPDETDIMSILLFGKPAAELSDSEGQAGAGMLSAAVGMMARNSLSRALGSGAMRTEIEFDSESFRVGRPLGDRLFASFEMLTQAEEDEGTFEVTLEWLINRYLYAEIGSGDGGSSADLFWRWRF